LPRHSSAAADSRSSFHGHRSPNDHPTHRMLQELMQLKACDDSTRELADRLLPWCSHGNYGRLFDGASNISLTGKIAHFELGYIPDSAKALRSAAGFLITNYTRQHIVTLPPHCENATSTKKLPV